MTPPAHRRLVLVALAGALALPAAAAAQAAQVISRAELDAGGWTRLSELFFAVRGVARTSVDGITVGGSVTSLPGWQLAPGHSSWRVLVDGQPVPVDAAGVTMLDLLPVSLAQLDSVTVRRSPTIAGGRIAMHGVLHLHTQRRVEGLRASASHYSGNEVGDPGPFAFTPLATPNVDNNGPFHHLRLAYGASAADVDLALRRWADNLTDIRLRQRYIDAAAPAAPHLWVNHLAPTARGGFSAFGTRHDIHAGSARTAGTFFVPAAREDQSLATVHTFAGLSGGTSPLPEQNETATRTTAATYRVALSALDVTDDGAMPATLAHGRRQLDAGVELSRHAGTAGITAGLSIAHRTLESAPAISAQDGEVEGDLYLSVASSRTLSPALALSAGAGIAGLRGGGIVSVAHALDARTRLGLTAAGRVHALGDDGAWIDLALFGLESLSSTRRTSLSAAAEWMRQLRGGAHLAVAATGRRELGLRVIGADTAIRLPSLLGDTGPALAFSNAELRTSLELPFGGALLGGATYRLTVPVGGSSEIRSASEMIPRHLLDATITVVPAFDIRVRPAVHVASATRWPGVAPGGESRVPAVTRLDLSVEKWMLARRLRLQVIGRNLLNDAERYHPQGADFRLRVFAGATAAF